MLITFFNNVFPERSDYSYLLTSGKIRIKSLHPELAGQAHGAHPIPLVYWNGLRYSWILIKTEEIPNKEGERDPWPQMFLILEGKGKAIIGNEEFEIKPKTESTYLETAFTK